MTQIMGVANGAIRGAQDCSRLLCDFFSQVKARWWLFFVSIEVGKLEDSPPLFPEELVEVVTVDHLEKEEMRRKSKLDECFLPSKSEPPRQGLPFFLDLHI